MLRTFCISLSADVTIARRVVKTIAHILVSAPEGANKPVNGKIVKIITIPVRTAFRNQVDLHIEMLPFVSHIIVPTGEVLRR